MIKSLSRMGTWKTYSIDDGLASLRIEHIAEDREGSIWFAAWDNGASRFDGDETGFSLFKRIVRSGCGLVPQRGSAGTTVQTSTLWRTTALQGVPCSSSTRIVRVVSGSAAPVP